MDMRSLFEDSRSERLGVEHYPLLPEKREEEMKRKITTSSEARIGSSLVGRIKKTFVDSP